MTSTSTAIKNESEKLNKFLSYDYSEVTKLLDEARKVGQSWSNSWLGYHSRVYYRNFANPPSGSHFSVEWGLRSGYDHIGFGSIGEWVEYESKDVVRYIEAKADNPDLSGPLREAANATETIEDIKNNILSLIHLRSDLVDNIFLNGLIKQMEDLKLLNKSELLKSMFPKKMNIITRDNHVEQQLQSPPHLLVETQCYEIIYTFIVAKKLHKILQRISDHLQNVDFKMTSERKVGKNVFIGHGRSADWRDLKDFLNERLGLQWDEFNRVSVAGLTNVTRLSQMLDQACIAFLVMTAEDEQAEGSYHARMNVVHEVGLFQGRLGFEKAIVLLEDGCEEFSNIQGLGQIRYPKGKISAIFEQIREVLERENIIDID